MLTYPLQAIPTFKPGVRVINDPNRKNTYVGFSHRGLEFENSALSQRTLELIDGALNIGQIQSRLAKHFSTSISILQIAMSIEPLITANLLSLVLAPNNQGSLQSTMAVNELSFQGRLKPEVDLIAWQKYPGNSGIDEITKRAKFSILIFGANRLALNLFALLQASGFSNTKIIDRINPIKKNLP